MKMPYISVIRNSIRITWKESTVMCKQLKSISRTQNFVCRNVIWWILTGSSNLRISQRRSVWKPHVIKKMALFENKIKNSLFEFQVCISNTTGMYIFYEIVTESKNILRNRMQLYTTFKLNHRYKMKHTLIN